MAEMIKFCQKYKYKGKNICFLTNFGGENRKSPNKMTDAMLFSCQKNQKHG